MSSKAHYDKILGTRYAWMVGERGDAVAAAEEELRSLGVMPVAKGERAIDLGCGTGVHSEALLNLGYAVLGVDNSEAILADNPLPDHAKVVGDIANFETDGAELVVCMGDTLCHLASESEVLDVLGRWRPGQHFVCSFRDYTGVTRPESFLVRGEPSRVQTCLVTPQDEARVWVCDTFLEHDGASWVKVAGSYSKLRLSGGRVTSYLEVRGATAALTHDSMIRVSAR